MERSWEWANPSCVPFSKANRVSRPSAQGKRMWSNVLGSWVVDGWNLFWLMDRSISTCSKSPMKWFIINTLFPPTQIIVRIYSTERRMTYQEVKTRRKGWKYYREPIGNSGRSTIQPNTDVHVYIWPYMIKNIKEWDNGWYWWCVSLGCRIGPRIVHKCAFSCRQIIFPLVAHPFQQISFMPTNILHAKESPIGSSPSHSHIHSRPHRAFPY